MCSALVGDPFLADLNAAVALVPSLPRVRFEVGLTEGADRWLRKKHADGAVHEPATLAAFLAIRERCECKHIFDVGALWGYFSLFAAALFPDAAITAFESHPSVIEPLSRNVDSHVTCVYGVVSDETREGVRLWVSGFNLYEEPEGGWDKLETVAGAMKQRGPENKGRGFMRHNLTTLDTYCALANVVPDLIKIDVEGYQAKAILGAMETIRRHRPAIVIELHDPDKLARFGITNASTVQPLFDLGYRAYWCGNHRDRDARFERVQAMEARHEKLSIMVFLREGAA
jgi:FkbM family methyltransferase